MVVIDTLTVEVEADIKNLDTGLDKSAAKLKQFDQETKKSSESIKKSTNSLDNMNAQLADLKKKLGAAEIGSKDFKKLQTEVTNTEAKIKKLSDTSGGMAGAFKKAGVAMAGLFALDKVTDFAKDAVLKFAAFEKGLARINTVAGVGQKELIGLGEDIKKVSEQYGIAKDELLDTAFNISSAGVEFDNINGVLELSSRVAVAAGTDTTTAFNGIIAVVKKYGLDLSEAGNIAEQFFITNKLGQTTIGEVASALQNLTSTVKNAGISTSELFAVYSSLTGVTGDANAVTTQLNGAINALAAPTETSSKLFKELGVEVGANAIKQKGLLGVIKDVYDATDGNLELLRKLIPEVEATKLVVALATTQYDKFADSTLQLSENQGALDDALAEITRTTDFKLSVMSEKWNNFKTNVGNALANVGYAILDVGVRVQALLKILTGFTAGGLIVIGDFVGGTVGMLIDLWDNFKAIATNIPEAFKAGMNKLPVIVQSALNKIFSKMGDIGTKLQTKLGLDKIGDIKIFDNVDFELPGFKRVSYVAGKAGDQITRLNEGIAEQFDIMKKGAGETSKAYADLKIGAQQFGSEIADQGEETEKQIKTLNSMNEELDALKTKLQGTEVGSAEFKKLQGEISAAEKEIKKYSGAQGSANSEAQKEIEKTAKALEDAVKNQVKDLEKLKEDGSAAYTDITQEITKQTDKITGLVDEYEDLENKIKDVGDKGAADIQKITDAIAELDEKLTGITTEGNLELAQRELDIKERLKDIEKERKDINSETSISDNLDKLNELKAEEKKLNEELAVLNENLSEEDRLAAETELTKTKTQLILDSIAAKKQEVEDEKAALEQQKVDKQAALDQELADLETLKEAKKAEAIAEGETLKSLIDTKNLLEESYLKAFGSRVEIEAAKVDSLTAKYKALAAAKAQAGYSGTVLGTAETLANQTKQEYDTRQTSEVKTASVNIYGDITNNNTGDLDNFTSEINSKINP